MLTRITTAAIMAALLGTSRALAIPVQKTRINELNNNTLADSFPANSPMLFNYPIDISNMAVEPPAPISFQPINKLQPTTTTIEPLTEKFISQYVSAPATIKKQLITLIYDIYNSDPIYRDQMTLAFHLLPLFAIAAYPRAEIKKQDNARYYWATRTIVVPSDAIDKSLPHYIRAGFKQAAAHATQLILYDDFENVNYFYPNTEAEMFKVDQFLRLGEERLIQAKKLLLSSRNSIEKRKLIDLQKQVVTLTPNYIHYSEMNADDLQYLKRSITLNKNEQINLDKVDKNTKIIRGNVKIHDIRKTNQKTLIEFEFLDLVSAMINKVLGNVASIKTLPHQSVNERAGMLLDGFPPILVQYFYPEFLVYQQGLYKEALAKAIHYTPFTRDSINFNALVKFDSEMMSLSRIGMRARHLKQFIARAEKAYSVGDMKWLIYTEAVITFALNTSHLLPFNYHDIFYTDMKNPYSEENLQQHLLLVADALDKGLLTDEDAKVEEQFNHMMREKRIMFYTNQNIDLHASSIGEEKFNFIKTKLKENNTATTNATTNATVNTTALKR